MQSSITAVVISFSNSMFPIFGISVGVYYLFINSWRIIVFILVVITGITTLLSYMYIEESPRWLLLNKKEEEKHSKCFAYLEIIKSEEFIHCFLSFVYFFYELLWANTQY